MVKEKNKFSKIHVSLYFMEARLCTTTRTTDSWTYYEANDDIPALHTGRY
jgi:hypothetical protein